MQTDPPHPITATHPGVDLEALARHIAAGAARFGPSGGVMGVDITPEQLRKAERPVRDDNVSFRRARIEELPFDDGSFDVVISNGVLNLSPDKRRVFSEAARVLRPGGRLALADIVTRRQIAARTDSHAELWAACIAGASQSELFAADLAVAGLELRLMQRNQDYRFTSERAKRTSEKYGAHSISLPALNPVRVARHPFHRDLGDGADVARAPSEEGSINTNTTQEVSQ